VSTEFERKLNEEGYFYQCSEEGYYNIQKKNRIQPPIIVQLITSRPVNKIIHGSQNGNDLDGIGYFHFSLNSEHNPEYFVFAFKHIRDRSSQYMIIPTDELRKRLKKNIIRYMSGQYFEFRLWLMENNLYDTTNMSLESEWYYLSAGRGGRMADQTEWNYSIYLNNWVLGSHD
jgi:hypothetical protein